MEPSGISWQALYERLKSGGDGVCLVPCPAVRNPRKTRQDGTRNTEEKEAYRICDLLRQGQCFLPVERDPERQAASRLRRRHRALKKRGRQLRNHLRAAIHLTCPALNPLGNALTQPTALRCLPVHPTPAAIRRNGQRRFLDTWQPRGRCGQGRAEQLQQLDDLAQHRIGLSDPYRIDALALTARAPDLAAAVAKPHLWLDKALEWLTQRPDFQVLRELPRLGKPTAAAILTASGDIGAYTTGQPLVTLAGLALRWFESGSRIRKLPTIAPVGSASLRCWLAHSALRLIAHAPHFTTSSQRRKHPSPGKGSGPRALRAVCDTTIRMISRILTAQAPYDPKQEKSIAQYSAAQRTAASA